MLEILVCTAVSEMYYQQEPKDNEITLSIIRIIDRWVTRLLSA